MEAKIRKAIASDVDTLVDLSRRTIDASYRPFLGDEAVDSFIGGDAIREYVQQSIDRCWVILTNGTVVGYSVFKDDLIDLVMVDHERHRRGLGGELLAHVEEELLQSFRELRLESFEGNDRANSFYRKRGWVEVDRRFDEDSGVNKMFFQKSARGS